jgi:hypothetical protein
LPAALARIFSVMVIPIPRSLEMDFYWNGH